MRRCVCNNYDISGFWRTWHASFNRWLIRYMYIPLGGQRWRLLNVWPIFTFVALWHDFEWHLLKWAWLMALCIAPEALCKAALNSKGMRQHHGAPWLRHLCAASAAGYITVRSSLCCTALAREHVCGLHRCLCISMRVCVCIHLDAGCRIHLRLDLLALTSTACVRVQIMMAANLVGYGLGQAGVQDTLQRVFSSLPTVVGMLATFYSAAQLMFQHRRLAAG